MRHSRVCILVSLVAGTLSSCSSNADSTDAGATADSDEADAVVCDGIGPDSGNATAVPTFHSLGLYWSPPGGASSKAVLVKYRKAGSCGWRDGLPMKYYPTAVGSQGKTDYRGSLVNLTPGTAYEIQLQLEGTDTVSVLTTSTWSETFPIGTTVTVSSQSAQYDITESGTATAYRVYDGTGTTIDVASNADQAITINASYVIVRGFVLKNARVHGIRILGGHDIVIEDCDISNWGRTAGDGGFGENYNSGIFGTAAATERVVVQRCSIHHPRTDANSWSELWDSSASNMHPQGPQCITFFNDAGNHVLRYNECWSDANHYFNDVLGGGDNSSLDGYPGPDTDIYNNYVANCWDDGLEIEGGGRNVRVWNNFVENCFSPYANASVTVGPLYLFRNVSGVSHSSAASSSPGYFLKAGYSTSESTMNGPVYLFHNTVLQPGGEGSGGFGTAETTNRHVKHTVSRNNLLHVRATNCISTHASNVDNDFDYDLCNVSFPSGHEAHGVIGAPSYAAGASFDFAQKSGDFRLTSGSPGSKAGTVIPNFSDGSSPDVGAQDSAAPAMKFGVTSTFVPAP